MKLMATGLSMAFLGASVLAGNLVYAGAADLKSSDGGVMKFEYRGDKLRINMDDDQGYMIVDDTGLYVVRDSDGQIMVVDAGKMMKMFGAMAGSAAPSVTSSEVVSLKATGRKEEHAGVRGEVYELQYKEEGSSKVQRTELVLSGDARVLELSHAMSGMARVIAKSAGKSLEGANEFERRLNKMDKGVLRYGDELYITAISDRKIDNARFVLPAEPQDLSSMSGLASFVNGGQSSESSEAGEKKSGSLVSGFLSSFGKKSSSGEDKSEDAEEEENALSKSLGKLFGK